MLLRILHASLSEVSFPKIPSKIPKIPVSVRGNLRERITGLDSPYPAPTHAGLFGLHSDLAAGFFHGVIVEPCGARCFENFLCRRTSSLRFEVVENDGRNFAASTRVFVLTVE